jgi:hypothetical protein
MFRVVFSPIIRSAYNCIYSIWYLSHRYCYLLLSWNIWNWFQRAVGGVRHPHHAQTGSNSSTIAADNSNGVKNIRCCRYSLCAPDDGWKYHPKHVEQFPDINKLCDVVSCWINEYTGILLGARPILHISRIKVKDQWIACQFGLLTRVPVMPRSLRMPHRLCMWGHSFTYCHRNTLTGAVPWWPIVMWPPPPNPQDPDTDHWLAWVWKRIKMHDARTS